MPCSFLMVYGVGIDCPVSGSILLCLSAYNTCGRSWCQPDRSRQGSDLWPGLESGHWYAGSREGVAYWAAEQRDCISTGDCRHNRRKGAYVCHMPVRCLSSIVKLFCFVLSIVTCIYLCTTKTVRNVQPNNFVIIKIPLLQTLKGMCACALHVARARTDVWK